jgi:dTDP-4-dehydrorhamnose reductase
LTTLNKVFFAGGSSLLAVNWANQIKNDCHVLLGIHQREIIIEGVETVLVGHTSQEHISDILKAHKPDLVINCSGLTSVEICESNPDDANHVNAELPEFYAKACAENRIKFVHISTDHLFSGRNSFTSETDIVEPINNYAISKYQGEQRVLKMNPDALIIRTNFYGWGTSYRKSFSDFIIESLRAKKSIELFENVYYTPIIIEVLVDCVNELIKLNEKGIFNVVGDERVTKLEFGIRIAEKFKLDKSLIKPVKFSERHDLVRRPLDLSLSNAKITSTINKKIGEITEHISILFNQESKGYSFKLNQI